MRVSELRACDIKRSGYGVLMKGTKPAVPSHRRIFAEDSYRRNDPLPPRAPCHEPDPPPHEAEPPRQLFALPLPLFHEAEPPRDPCALPLPSFHEAEPPRQVFTFPELLFHEPLRL